MFHTTYYTILFEICQEGMTKYFGINGGKALAEAV